jgi:zinc transporter ZupT
VCFFFLSALARATPWALGFSSSAMFYVVFVELLPDVVQGGVRRRGAIAFLAGIATAYLLGAVVGR